MSKCGDGIIASNEVCDDGNANSYDGCSHNCKFLETGFDCPTPGQKCFSTCGDGRRAILEACDDKNTKDGDGCSKDCLNIEPGFYCDKPGESCTSKCGDGIKASFKPDGLVDVPPGEKCDDGNKNNGDGCLGDCSAVEEGWTCKENA